MENLLIQHTQVSGTDDHVIPLTITLLYEQFQQPLIFNCPISL